MKDYGKHRRPPGGGCFDALSSTAASLSRPSHTRLGVFLALNFQLLQRCTLLRKRYVVTQSLEAELPTDCQPGAADMAVMVGQSR